MQQNLNFGGTLQNCRWKKENCKFLKICQKRWHESNQTAAFSCHYYEYSECWGVNNNDCLPTCKSQIKSIILWECWQSTTLLENVYCTNVPPDLGLVTSKANLILMENKKWHLFGLSPGWPWCKSMSANTIAQQMLILDLKIKFNWRGYIQLRS